MAGDGLNLDRHWNYREEGEGRGVGSTVMDNGNVGRMTKQRGGLNCKRH